MDEINPLATLQERLAQLDSQESALDAERDAVLDTFRVRRDAIRMERKRTERAIRYLGGATERGAS